MEKKKEPLLIPCGDMKIHDTAYFDGMKNDFIAARGVGAEMLTIIKLIYTISAVIQLTGKQETS